MSKRSEAAKQIIAEHRNLAFGAAALPVPIVDSLAVIGVNLRMLDRLSGLCGVPFAEDRAKKIVSALFAGTASGVLARRFASGGALKWIPGLGSVVGALTQAAFAAAATHAVGHLFLEHFQCGGDFSDFDPEEQQPAFDRALEEAGDSAGAEEMSAASEAADEGNEASAPADQGANDDLRKIEGIGPKIAGLLEEVGICTWAALAASSADELREVLDRAGPRYRMHDPTTWPQQAALAARGAWDELAELQQELQAGRARS